MTSHEPNLPEKLQDAVRHVVCDGVLVVGEYEVFCVESGRVCIYKTDGEGGQFNTQAFLDVVKKFYDENF